MTKTNFWLVRWFFGVLIISPMFPGQAIACKCATWFMSTRQFLDQSAYCALIRIKSSPVVEPELVSEDSGVQVYRFAAPDWIPLKVEVLERFKGDSNISMLLLGDVLSSCDLGVNAGEQWIVFLKKNADGQLTLSACNGSIRFRSSDVLKDEGPLQLAMIDSLRIYSGLRTDRPITRGIEVRPPELPEKRRGNSWPYFGLAAFASGEDFAVLMRQHFWHGWLSSFRLNKTVRNVDRLLSGRFLLARLDWKEPPLPLPPYAGITIRAST